MKERTRTKAINYAVTLDTPATAAEVERCHAAPHPYTEAGEDEPFAAALPQDFPRGEFTTRQLGILAAYYADHLAEKWEELCDTLNTMPAGCSITAARVGVNALLLSYLVATRNVYASLGRDPKGLARNWHCNDHMVAEQFKALLQKLRENKRKKRTPKFGA